MNNFLLLFVLCLLIIRSKCGPEIFKFTSQPESQTVNPGGTVTLSCVATGRTDITYSWYQLDTGFNTPPSGTNYLISGATGTQYEVDAADVDESGEDNLFQCKATAGNDVILSDVATVKYTLTDNIEYNSNGQSYLDQVVTTPDKEVEAGVYLFRIQCNANEDDFDNSITNGEPYDVQWFKEGESGRVEDNHDNMWTYYNPTKSSDYKIEFAGDNEVTLSTVGRYDLVIVSVRTTDKGKYSCKAVSRVNNQEVLLGSTDLKVPLERDYPVNPLDIITGYMVLSVDDTGKLKSHPNVGDKVLLMCGAACRTSGGSYDAQYQWKDSTNKVIANTREHIVTVDSVGSATFTCEILNSECNSDVSSEDVTFTSNSAEINPMLQFTFSKSPPEYMWYDTFDGTKSQPSFEIGCEGSLGSGNIVYYNAVYKMPKMVTSASATEVYNFGSSITSDKSGVYQCGIYNDPNRVLWYQKTTNVVIAARPTAAITPTIVSVQDDTTATFTCTVDGYPIESVTISGPNSLSFDCLTSGSSGDVTCVFTDKIDYVVNVNKFKLEYAGDYKCTVETKWYKSATGSASAIVNSASDDVTLSYESTTELTVSKNPADKGSSVTLICVVKGDPEPGEPELTKTVDSSPSTIAMTCSGTTTKTCKKVFSDASYTDSGLYTCNGKNVINSVDKVSSDSVTLKIEGIADATLTQAPAESELLKGSSVTFTCKVEGNPLPTKLIFKEGTQIIKSYPSGSDTDVDKDTYHLSYEHTIDPLELLNTGDYSCEGENENGGTQPDTKTLTVVSDVTVSLSASTDKPSFGDAFTITCTATGGRKPHSVTLTHEGTAISTGAFPCIDDGDYSKKCTYTHTVNDYSAGGTYTCTGLNRVAGNSVRTDIKSVKISVSKTVVVSLTPASETEVSYGSAYTITCKVEGGNKPHKVTLNIPDSSTDLIWQRGSLGNSLTCTGEYSLVCKYGMSSSVYSNEGQYSCTGYNKLPDDNNENSNSATGSLVVVKNVELQLTDTITSNLNEVNYGNDFKITCVAEGGRIPFYLELIQTPLGSSTPKELVLYDTTASKTPDSVTVDDGGNTLTYVNTVTSSGYDDIGTYKCSSKNEAASKAEQDAEDEVDIVVVRNVTSTISNFDIVDKGSQLKITCTAEGYRPPHNIALEKDGKSVIDWNNLTSSTECTTLAFYKFECVHSVTDVGYTNGGSYKCISKNYALGSKEVIGEDDKTLQISQTVLTQLDPLSERELELGGSSLSITCNIEGGNQPHKATMKLPDGSILIWNRDTAGGVQNNITCTGDNEIDCVHEVTSTTFDNTGDYNCTGYNKIPADSTTVHTESKIVGVVIVRDVTASITSTAGSDEVDFGTELKLTCKVEGGRTPFFLSVYFTNRANITSKIIEHDKTDQSDQIIQSKSSLEYVHTISNITYDSNGSYKCTGKNNALGNQERTDESSKSAVVVRDVRIDQKDNIAVDFGTSLVFNFQLNGGRSPHLVKLDSESSNIFNWEDNSNVCTGTNTLTCTKTIGENDVNWTYDGTFTVTAENRARSNSVITDTMEFSVTVYKDVVAIITPSSEETISYHEDKTITCKVEGGLSPHQVDLILPNLGTKTWKKDGSMTSLQCSGEHELTCMHTFTPEYNSDGDYKCKGYNEGRSGQKENKSEVKLTTVRQTQLNVSKETISVLTNGVIEVNCIIVGKPLVEISSVTWTHSNSTDLDLSDFVDTVKGNQDDFTLISTLTKRNPSTNYTGILNCNVADHDGKTISKAVNVFINNREFLEPPEVSYNDAKFIEKGSQIFITCLVQGFPAPSASLTYEGQDSMLKTTEPQSVTSTKFVFSVTTTCDYLNLNFSCNANTTTSSEVLKESAQIVGPSITGCENPLPVILGGGIGGGAVFFIIIAIVVFFIVRRIKGRQDRSYTPKNGAEFPSHNDQPRHVTHGSRNPTFTPDPTYATVGDNQVGGPGGYSHLNRPVGETDEEGYASIGQLKPGTVLASGEDAYATLDSTSNGMLGLKRQGSNETYAALDRPAPGKAKRGVIRKYKPISNKPKTFGMPPNKPATEDIEMGETSHGGQPDPTYATVNPATLKTKAKASDYADVTLPDLPPEVPIYGQSSHRQRPIPSEYADATLPPPPPQTPYNMADKQQPILSEYADVTLPGPPEVLYSNMADRQNDTLAEDPVYAQIDLKNRTMPQRRVEEEEDLPPDVPVYGTMGELTEPYSPDLEDEDPYATVEFVPKSKRKPPRPKPKENANEGVYATITDIKENV